MQAATEPMAPINPIKLIDPTDSAAAAASAAADADAAGLAVVVAGVSLRLLAGRAVWWPEASTLFVADVHLGKAESFSALGVPVPRGPTAATLDRLAGLVEVPRRCRMRHR